MLTGMLTTLLGPILPVLSLRWSLSDSQAGSLFTSQFLGSMMGAAISSPLMMRQGYQLSLVLGFAMMATGVCALASLSTWVAGLISVFCYGVGLGITIPTTNLWIAQANPTRRAAALNLLNLAWGAGAVTCPFLVALAQRTKSVPVLLFGLATAACFLLVCIASVSFASIGQTLEGRLDPLPLGRNVWRTPFLPILGVLFLLYVGTENALAGWVATYAQRMGATPGMVWVLMPSFFWGALLLGRTLAPTVLRYAAEATLVRVGLGLAAIGVATLLVVKTQSGVALGASLAGFGLASVFPILVALLSETFGTQALRVAGALFACGGLGGATLPWLVGVASTHFGSLKAGLVVPLLGSLIMIALCVVSRRATMSNSGELGAR